MQCRNRLWKAGKSYWKNPFKDKCGDIKRLNPDGTVKEVIPINITSNKPFQKITKENNDIINERQSERYIEWREAILKRDRKTCVLCQSKEWLQAHHITRWKDDESKRYDLSNGITLCIPCHYKYHGPQMQPFPKSITKKLLEHIKTLYG